METITFPWLFCFCRQLSARFCGIYIEFNESDIRIILQVSSVLCRLNNGTKTPSGVYTVEIFSNFTRILFMFLHRYDDWLLRYLTLLSQLQDYAASILIPR
jgi:hypothetical protein